MRKMAFDVSFYPGNKETLSEFVEKRVYSAKVAGKALEAKSYIAPHAGYAYSGKTAGFTYDALAKNKSIAEFQTIVVIGPNHTGAGNPIAVSAEDWETPFGAAMNDLEFSRAIAESSSFITIDEEAHKKEHSVEVQLPFIKKVAADKSFAFVCMGDQSMEASEELSNSIINAEKKTGRNVLVVASSDMNHYEPVKVTKEKDEELIKAIEKLDATELSKLAESLEDSACGIGPIVVAMKFGSKKKAEKGILLNYSTSGDSTEDYTKVVGYASFAIA
jgi:AmmeMemoRadiSam system protein B